ncbi:MAG: alpha/beta hydrolase [Chloroflexi bacterium]|nr:alpha/beta hydrolase [Chloroflexota bacterium]
MIKRILIFVALVTLSIGCTPQRESPLDEQVDIGTHKLHIYCVGTGTPVIVIDVGFGESYTSWQSVQDQLAQDTRVCTYDRAGYGQSEPGPMPRHSKQASGELKLLLENAGIEGPYLLVGHSLGGLNMQVFASQYSDVVVGAVLLDPPPLRWITGGGEFPELYEMFNQETQGLSAAAEALSQSANPEEKATASFYQTLASEHEELFGESAQQVAAIRSFADMPLVVIASGKANPAFGDSAEAFQQFWIEQSRELADKSTRGHFILAEESGHHIHQDAPDMVLDAVRGMLQQIR